MKKFFFKIRVLILTLLILISCQKNESKVEQKINEVVDFNKKDSLTVVEIEGWKLKDNRKDLFACLEEVSDHGLNPNDYQFKNLSQFESKFEQLDSLQKENYYQLLNKSFKKLYFHLYNGKLNPSKIYPDWDLTPKPLDLDKILATSLKDKKIKFNLNDAAPKHTQYIQLKKELKNYKNNIGKDLCNIELNDKLFVGSKHPAVKQIKKKLLILKDVKKIDSSSVAYDDSMLEGVKKFQGRHGIEASGVIDIETFNALNASVQNRYEQIIVNMERWRWFPRDLGNQYLLINIPEFFLHYYSDGKLQESHKVIVGSEKRKSPIVTSKIQYMVWNPTWAVPTTILKEDYIPAMIENKEYLLKKKITIFDKNQQIVKPEDWTPEKAYHYKYIQEPGEHNLLGKLKFVFENRHFIYLHDTNNKHFFEQKERDLSSGCIRVEKPIELGIRLSTKLANYVVKNRNEAQLITKNFYSDEPVKVHVLYYTAWGDEFGLNFRKDIYNLDVALYKEFIK
jgi:murein L,D-transpeptidase YcbB/YkuD